MSVEEEKRFWLFRTMIRAVILGIAPALLAGSVKLIDPHIHISFLFICVVAAVSFFAAIIWPKFVNS